VLLYYSQFLGGSIMARPAIVTKEEIIACAFDIAQSDGKNAITIREISHRLGISTAPIYTQYSSIDDIMSDLNILLNRKFSEYTMTQRSENHFLDIGLGFIDFVIHHKKIFTDFFVAADGPVFQFDVPSGIYLNQMKKTPILNLLSEDRLKRILDDMVVYTYGLAINICAKIEPSDDYLYYKQKLGKVGNRLISYHMYSAGIYEDVLKEAISKSHKGDE